MSRLSLPVALLVGALALSASAPAQTANPLAVSAPIFQAGLDHPYSSSIRPDTLFAAHAQTSSAAPSYAGAPKGSSSPFSGIGVGVKVGLAGIGFDVATPLVPSRLNLRGGASFFSYNLNETTSDNLIVNGTLKLQNSGIMLDWFPWHGKFRISGGATIYNNKGVTATVTEPTGSTITLGNDKYYSSSSNPLTGTGVFKLGGNTGGRVSFGTGNLLPKKGRFTFQSELGIEFVSAPTVALAFSGSVCTQAQGANCASPTPVSAFPQFQTDVVAEQSKLQNDVNFVKFYPILSIGLGYRIH